MYTQVILDHFNPQNSKDFEKLLKPILDKSLEKNL